MYIYRKSMLDIYARIGITKEAYEKLRRLKKSQKESMAGIVSQLIMNQDEVREVPERV
jgi:predicted CopG family antitoxin